MNAITPRRKPTNVTLDAETVAEARALGVNVSRACQTGLAKEVKAAREAAFKKEFAPTAAYWNDYVERNGLPLAKHRMF